MNYTEDPDWTTPEEAEEYVVKLKNQIADLTRRLEEANDQILRFAQQLVMLVPEYDSYGIPFDSVRDAKRILAEKPTGAKPSLIADLTRQLEEARRRAKAIIHNKYLWQAKRNAYAILAEKPTGGKPSVENPPRERAGGVEGGGL